MVDQRLEARFANHGVCLFTGGANYCPEPPSVTAELEPVLEWLRTMAEDADPRKAEVAAMDREKVERLTEVMARIQGDKVGSKTRQNTTRGDRTMDHPGAAPQEQAMPAPPVIVAENAPLAHMLSVRESAATRSAQDLRPHLRVAYAKGDFIACFARTKDGKRRQRNEQSPPDVHVWFGKVGEHVYKAGDVYNKEDFEIDWLIQVS